MGTITDNEKNRMNVEISFDEVSSCIKKLRLSATGGCDGVMSRLPKTLNQFLPKYILGAVRSIVNGGVKPPELTERFLIFIKKPNSDKKTYKKYSPINILSNILKISSRIIVTRIENDIINSETLPRTLYDYFKERSTMDMVRADLNKDNIWVLLYSDYSAAFDSVSRSHIYSTSKKNGLL